MKLGINDHTFYSSGIPADAFDYIDRVSELGLSGIHFSTTVPFSSLSDDYMLRVGERIRKMGFYVELGMGACNPYSSCRAPRDVDRDPRESLRELIHAAGFIGAEVVRTLFGFLEADRLGEDPPLDKRIEATIEVLCDVKGFAEDKEVRIAVENHLDLTTKELLNLIEAVDSEYVGVCFDFANQISLLEDDAESAEALGKYIYTTHFKDGVIFPTEDGAAWVRTPLGDGFIDLRSIIKTIHKYHPEANLNIEDLPDVFQIPIFNDEYMDSLKEIKGSNVARFIKLLREGDRIVKEGKLPLNELKGPGRHELIKNRIPADVERAKKLLEELGI